MAFLKAKMTGTPPLSQSYMSSTSAVIVICTQPRGDMFLKQSSDKICPTAAQLFDNNANKPLKHGFACIQSSRCH